MHILRSQSGATPIRSEPRVVCVKYTTVYNAKRIYDPSNVFGCSTFQAVRKLMYMGADIWSCSMIGSGSGARVNRAFVAICVCATECRITNDVSELVTGDAVCVQNNS